MSIKSTVLVVTDTQAERSQVDISTPFVFCVETNRFYFSNGTWQAASCSPAELATKVDSTDSRLSNARTPIAHATSHQNGGTDEIATITAGANLIPKAGVGGKLAAGWISSVLASSDLTNDSALEKVANKNAASGYVGLSAGSKIAASQVSGVLASSDLTNDSALEKVANKNAVSGYAGLDASSKLSGAQQVYGSAVNTACQGNDSRLSDSRTPTGTAGGDLAGTYPNPTIKTSVALSTPNIGAATGTSLAATGAITSSGTAGMGYATGAGGTVTQATSKSTAVTLNKVCGDITMSAAALAAGTIVSFTVNNSTVAATDMVLAKHKSGGTLGAYTINAGTEAAGTFVINVRNNTGGSLSEALVIRFMVHKGATA